MNTITVTVGIPVHNEEQNIGSLLAALSSNSSLARIIVVDDESTDESPNILAKAAKEYDNVVIVKAAERGGQLSAWFEAARSTDSEIVVFIDGDALPGERAIENLVAGMLTVPNTVIASGSVRPSSYPSNFRAARFRADVLHEIRSLGFAKEAVIGRFFAVQRSWFLSLAKRTDIIANDTYFSCLAEAGGHRALYVPAAVCYYAEASNTLDFAAQRQRADAGYRQLRDLGILTASHEPNLRDYFAAVYRAGLRDPVSGFHWIVQQAIGRFLRAYKPRTANPGIWEAQSSTKSRLDCKPITSSPPIAEMNGASRTRRSRNRISVFSRYDSETNPGGIETVVSAISSRIALLRPHWDVRSVCAFKKMVLVSKVPYIVDIAAAIRAFAWALRSDIIVVNGSEYAWLIALFPLLRRRTLIVWHGTRACEIPSLRPHLNLALRIYRSLEIALQGSALKCDNHVVVAPSVNAEISLTYGVNADFPVILNGAPETINQEYRNRFNESHSVIWIGTNVYRKGLDVAIDACRMARKADPRIRLAVYGVPRARGLDEPWIDWYGVVPRSVVLTALVKSFAMVAATRYEACSMAVLEAMSLGVPVVGSPAVAWMLPASTRARDWKAESFANVLIELAQSPAARASVVNEGLCLVKKFDWDRAAESYVAILAKIEADLYGQAAP